MPNKYRKQETKIHFHNVKLINKTVKGIVKNDGTRVVKNDGKRDCKE
jgi:hypothetical protein